MEKMYADISLHVAKIEILNEILRILQHRKKEFKEEIERATESFFEKCGVECRFDFSTVEYQIEETPAERIWIIIQGDSVDTEKKLSEVLDKDSLDFEVAMEDVFVEFGMKVDIRVS